MKIKDTRYALLDANMDVTVIAKDRDTGKEKEMKVEDIYHDLASDTGPIKITELLYGYKIRSSKYEYHLKK